MDSKATLIQEFFVLKNIKSNNKIKIAKKKYVRNPENKLINSKKKT